MDGRLLPIISSTGNPWRMQNEWQHVMTGYTVFCETTGNNDPLRKSVFLVKFKSSSR